MTEPAAWRNANLRPVIKFMDAVVAENVSVSMGEPQWRAADAESEHD